MVFTLNSTAMYFFSFLKSDSSCPNFSLSSKYFSLNTPTSLSLPQLRCLLKCPNLSSPKHFTLNTFPKVPCSEGTVTLAIPDEQGDGQILDSVFLKQGPRLGTVQICYDERLQSICGESWNNEEASVVCRQLGLSPYGKLHYK